MSGADGDSPLLAHLRARIEREGPLPVDEYMRSCLADPEYGYWQRQATIGADGDFVTAPEISQVFGELIGLWAGVLWRTMGAPAPVNLVELGPGRGTLLRDALRAARSIPDFLAAASVHLIERSAPLREAQRRTLAALSCADDRHRPGHACAVARAVTWHEAIGTVPKGATIVIANEFLDALPIRQLVWEGGKWHERVVDLEGGGRLRFAVGPATEVSAEAPRRPGAVLELRDGEEELLAALARREGPLVALFIDYGPMHWATGDTLQAVHRHAWVDPLSRPGRADLTAHVAFARLADKARSAGLGVDGPMTQAEFLGRLGAVERAARLMAANPREAGAIEGGVQRLISPSGMGGLCKVLAVRSGHLPAVVPFR
ncbi:MAG TPA: SAM-dependent methyltransferase [Hyphomicrobiaceae bacterium]|nr:SAM-dependent methyltransferase [Hyphomicrobiaceae bacterium]